MEFIVKEIIDKKKKKESQEKYLTTYQNGSAYPRAQKNTLKNHKKNDS